MIKILGLELNIHEDRRNGGSPYSLTQHSLMKLQVIQLHLLIHKQKQN